ncbi:hypothetical protein [Vibrio cionasavignyae]|uniref:hypothetical protein n=1 Tax=Vibrio cionasavignyae TaxID=2910252 RepID=UPI003D13028E
MKLLVSLFILVAGMSSASEFSPATEPVDGCPGDFFVQKARVFDAVTICATENVESSKIKHAANVTAQWLDNNEDGSVDEPALLSHLRQNHATLIMTRSGLSEAAFESLSPYLEYIVGQDLSADETNPKSSRDASQEEIHHLIVNAGWQWYLPLVFSDSENQQSLLRKQWQLADEKGLYRYNDPTCDSACKTVEFFYLGTAAYLGSAADLQSDEMGIKNKQALREELPGLVKIFESELYHYPIFKWPDGHYPYRNSIRYVGLKE